MERQFIIVNKNNKELSFNSTDIFGHTPEGLGVEFEATTYQAYNSFNDMVLTVKQNEISLKLTLGNDSQKPYAAYMKLLKFLNVGNLILRYVVPDVGTFERKIALRSLSKKDMDLYSVLQEDIKFSAMSPWYSWVHLSKNFDRVLNSGRIWDDSRIYQTKYAYSWSNTGLAGTIYSAYSWSSDGKDRFTTIFPNLNIMPDSRLLSGNTSAFAAQSGSTISINSSIKGLNVSSHGSSTVNTQQGFGISKQLSATAGKVYTLSGYVKNTSPNGKAITQLAPQLGFYNSAATPLGYFNKAYNIPNDGEEHLVSFTYTAPDNTALYKAWFLDITEFANEAHSFTIRDMKVEEGAIVTTWMPTSDEVSDGDYPSYLGSARVDNAKTPPNFNLLKNTRTLTATSNASWWNTLFSSEQIYDSAIKYKTGVSAMNFSFDVFIPLHTEVGDNFAVQLKGQNSQAFGNVGINDYNTIVGQFDKIIKQSDLGKTIRVSTQIQKWGSYKSFDTALADTNSITIRQVDDTSGLVYSNIKLEEGSTATEWMPAASETTVTDTMQPTEYNAYVWLPTNIQSGKDPVVYRGDFTREFPRLNLLDGTRDFSGDWINGGNWVNDGSYRGLRVKSYQKAWDGIFKKFIVPQDGLYTWSSFVKSESDTSNIFRVLFINNIQSPIVGLGRKFDWLRDSVTVSLKKGDEVIFNYGNSEKNGGKLSVAGYKLEQGTTATPWMPASEEVKIDDYPSFLGKYEGLGSPDLDDPLMYSWRQYGYQLAVDQNMVVEPDFSIDPPLLANTESKKQGTNWQVFNTGTNVGSTVTKTADGLKLVNTGNNTLYLRPNKPITLNGNNVYRLEYDVTVSSVQQNNDLYIVFTNQYQLPSYTDLVSVDVPYIKIPLTGEVTTNKDVTFNPISVHNMVADTKTHRIIDITVPFGYNYAVIQAVNGSQSATTYNNFKLSYPIDTINHPANGPYSIISPKTNVYQVDYSRASSYLEIENDSMYFGTQEDSSLRIVIKATPTTGNIKNPSWYLTDANGNKLQTEGFLTGIPVGYELVVSSDPFERLMVLRDSSGKLPDTEIDTYIDPMSTGWIRVPLGESRLILSDSLYSATGGFNAGSVSLEYKKEWVIV
ncbi:tail protein [Lactococcus phage P092]|uniref:Capsid and scaffold protein n=1 Tax=Lactococcus phage P092 TaxID=1476887 RepID=X4YGN8_9CAUD|nr:tail protein [Lactococcus phage P092]AHV83060.1 capsid and scaffold protein [Lactococcus phage P092]